MDAKSEADLIYSSIDETMSNTEIKPILLRVATLGHAVAQYRLSSGGFTTDINERTEWCMKSAQTYHKAMFTLSCAYIGSYPDFTVERCRIKSLEWCKKAADLGNEEAIFKIRSGTYDENQTYKTMLENILVMVEENSNTVAYRALKATYDTPYEVYSEIYSHEEEQQIVQFLTTHASRLKVLFPYDNEKDDDED